MYYVPQTPCCTPQPIVTPCGGDPCSAQPIGSQSVVYSGPNLPCTGIQTCNNLSVAFQKVDEKICDLQDQINILVNALNVCCPTTTTTSTSSTSSTTTSTTTIACPECTFYSVSNETITPATINYYACGGVYTNMVVGAFGTIYICACTGSVVVPPLPGLILSDLGTCPTTTTTTTSSSSTTTTTTTLLVGCFCYTIENPTEAVQSFTFQLCDSPSPILFAITPGATERLCSSIVPFGENCIVTGGTSPCTVNGDCLTTTTTTTLL